MLYVVSVLITHDKHEVKVNPYQVSEVIAVLSAHDAAGVAVAGDVLDVGV